MNALKNPWVIGGGVVLGLVILLSRSGGNSAPASSGFADVMSANNAMSANVINHAADVGMQAQLESTKTNAAISVALIGAAENAFAVSNNTAVQTLASQNDVWKTQIQGMTATQIDRQQQNARLDYAQITDWGLTTRTLAALNAKMNTDITLATLSAGVQTHQIDVSARVAPIMAKIQSDTQLGVASINSNAAIAAAMIQGFTQQAAYRASETNAMTNLGGQALGGIFGLGKSFMTGLGAPNSRAANGNIGGLF